MRERMLWVGIGVLSLLLAAALGLATSKLTEAPVGLSAEPVSAGEALAPSSTPDARATPDATREPRKPKPTPTPTRTATPAPAAPPAETDDDDNSGKGSSDDDGGSDDDSGQGRGRGRSDDDD